MCLGDIDNNDADQVDAENTPQQSDSNGDLATAENTSQQTAPSKTSLRVYLVECGQEQRVVFQGRPRVSPSI